MSTFHRVRESLFATWCTRCPLCELASQAGLLCAGCEHDCFASRQQRALCSGCAGDRGQVLGKTDTHCSEICPSCQRKPPPYQFAFCAMDYAFPAQWLMADFKVRARLSLARPMAHLMLKAAQLPTSRLCPDVWVPVPASRYRLRMLGFSPAQQLAWHMSRLSGVPIKVQWLNRVRETGSQKRRTRAQRLGALTGSMMASPAVAGRWVGVVDDVMTTGSTVSEAARALLAAGARGVTVVAAMRTPDQSRAG